MFAAHQKKLGQLTCLTKKQVRILITLGILEILTTTSFFISINIIADPSVTSFLGNMFPVMVTLGGIFILKEKLFYTNAAKILLVLVFVGFAVLVYIASKKYRKVNGNKFG